MRRRPRSDIPSCAGEHGICLAQKLHGLAGLGQHSERMRELGGLLAHGIEVRVEAGEYDDAACWEVMSDIPNQGKAVASGQCDVAQHQIWRKLMSALERFFSRVGLPGIIAILLEDPSEGVSDQPIVVNNQNSLHLAPFATAHIQLHSSLLRVSR